MEDSLPAAYKKGRIRAYKIGTSTSFKVEVGQNRLNTPQSGQRSQNGHNQNIHW